MQFNNEEKLLIQEMSKVLAEKILKKYPGYNSWSQKAHTDNVLLAQLLLVSEIEGLNLDFDQCTNYLLCQINNPLAEA